MFSKKESSDLYHKIILDIFKEDPSEPFLNLSFFLSFLLTLLFGCKTSENLANGITSNILELSNDLFAISVGGIGVVLGALAIMTVVFSKKVMNKAAEDGSFQALMLPYIVSCFSWGFLSLTTFFYLLLKSNLNQRFLWIFSLLILFFTLYSILYSIRLIITIIRFTVLAALYDKD